MGKNKKMRKKPYNYKIILQSVNKQSFAASLIFSLIVLPMFLHAVYADTAYLNTTITNLNGFTKNTVKSYSVFYPLFFIIILAIFMGYGLVNREDKIAAVFTIAAMILSMLLTFMFLAPVDYTFTYTDTKITAEQSQLSGGLVNNTSVVKNVIDAQVIPHDTQFRLYASIFFSTFSLLNGLLTILIFTKWGKGNTTN